MKSPFYIISLIGLVLSLALAACNEPLNPCKELDLSDVDEEQLAKDIAIIDSTLAARGIDDYETHSSGLRYRILEKGSGDAIIDYCSGAVVHFNGRFLDTQEKFDSSIDRGEPFIMRRSEGGLRNVIKGWQIGLPYIRVGGSIEIYVPSGLAYGANGRGDNIPANAILMFDIELLGVTN